MQTKTRMIMALVLAGAAITCAAFAAPDYLSAVNAAKQAHQAAPKAPGGMMLASLIGLASWLSVVTVQWRKRQYGWLIASFLLSYLGVIAYAVRTLSQLRAGTGTGGTTTGTGGTTATAPINGIAVAAEA